MFLALGVRRKAVPQAVVPPVLCSKQPGQEEEVGSHHLHSSLVIGGRLQLCPPGTGNAELVTEKPLAREAAG